VHLGCHAVLFRERIKSETETIIKGLAETGFEGSEIGARFFGTEDKETLLQILDKYNYQLSGMHVGGTLKSWADPDSRKQLKKTVLAAAKFVQDMPNKNVVLSGGRLEEGTDLLAAVEGIEETARECLRLGVKLNYHNHSWEFEDNARIYNALVEHAPSLHFGFDLGWVYVGGFDPIEIVEKHKDRISYVHLRDVDESNKFVEIGEGVFHYPKLMELLKDVLGEDGWAVVEYEEGEQDFNRYKKAKAFLDRIINA
jgi:inosose dehydratase